jgi:hypothetical protein
LNSHRVSRTDDLNSIGGVVRFTANTWANLMLMTEQRRARVAWLFAILCVIGMVDVIGDRYGAQPSAASLIPPEAKRPPADSATHVRTIDSVLAANERAIRITKDPLPSGALAGVVPPITPLQLKRSERLRVISGTRVAALAQLVDEKARMLYAKKVDDTFLDAGFDVKATATGARHKTLRLDYLLAGRVFSHQLEKMDDFWRTARQLGFTRVELIGYDFTNAWAL